jgi:ABC-2 type transport system permease protein
MRWIRVKALIIKEFLALLRDPRGRVVLFAPPIIQLFVFSYAATLEVTNVDVMVLNRDAGSWGQELVHRIDGAPTFRTVTHAQHPDAVRAAIDTQQIIAAIQIGPSFSRDIEAGLPTDIEIILDGQIQRISDRRRLSR